MTAGNERRDTAWYAAVLDHSATASSSYSMAIAARETLGTRHL